MALRLGYCLGVTEASAEWKAPPPWRASPPRSAPLSRQVGLSLGFAEGFPGLPSSEPCQLTASWTEVI